MKFAIAGIVLISAMFLIFNKGTSAQVEQATETLKVRITGTTAIPDSAKIESAGDWYYADHISSGLVAYENEQRKFAPLYASDWNVSADGSHVFKLRPNIKFSDGTPITTKDIAWTIKRLLILKSSTHFPLWEYVVGCESLKTLNDDCSGLIYSNSEIRIKLKTINDSFFLQLASPETAIWSADDMDSTTCKIAPTKFSGPYSVATLTSESATLVRNENSPISQKFKNSPRSIILKAIPLKAIDESLVDRTIDLAVRSYKPYQTVNWASHGLRVQSTTPSSIIYLQGTGNAAQVGQDFVEALWRLNSDTVISPAETFLPFSKTTSISKDEFLQSLPPSTSKTIRLIGPEGFFSDGLIDLIKSAGLSVQADLQFTFVPSKEWFAAFEDPKTKEKFDFILSSYAASERYPAVQLRYITHPLVKPPIDLKLAESPTITADNSEILRDYEKWLLRSQVAIPLFFNVTQFIFRESLDLGNQSLTDAEIELWRIQESSR